MSADKPLVSLQKLCQALRLTSRRVQQLISDGIIPKPEGATKAAKYDLLGSIWAYFAWKEAQAVQKATKKAKSTSRTEDEIKEIERETKQFKLDKEKGLYILRQEVADELVSRIVILKRDFKVLENRLLKHPEARDIVRKAHYNMMAVYSKKTGVFRGKK